MNKHGAVTALWSSCANGINSYLGSPISTSADLSQQNLASVYARLRDPSRAIEYTLSTDAEQLLASIPSRIRPYGMAAQFPRILNDIAHLWMQPAQLRPYLDKLLLDERGKRAGFQLNVMMELMDLRAYYLEYGPSDDSSGPGEATNSRG